jgi:hypothetical protein
MIRLFCSVVIFLLSQPSVALDDDGGLGELKYKGDLPGEWMYVVGQKDTMMLSKTGRFSIVSHDGALRITDLWKEQSITFKEMAERFNQYPINEIAQRNKYKPLKLGDPKKASKYSIFLMLGDEHSIDFFKAAEGDLVASGADVYVLAGKNVNSFYAYTCGSTELKMEILKGLDTTIGSDNCNQAMMIRKGTAVRATAELLRIKRVPFAVINANDNGAVVNYKSFGSLK